MVVTEGVRALEFGYGVGSGEWDYTKVRFYPSYSDRAVYEDLSVDDAVDKFLRS
jgi:hypothetical protein